MKKLLVPMLAFCLLFASACKNSGASGSQAKPDKVALNFMRSFAELDLEKAKPLCTEDGQKAIGALEMILANASDEDKATLKSRAGAELEKIKSANCRTEGEFAYCKICCDDEGNETGDEPIRLKKISGKWYVDIDKSTLMGGSGEMPD